MRVVPPDTNRTTSLVSAAIPIAGVSIVVVAALFVTGYPGISKTVAPALSRLAEKIAGSTAEYLFFVGTTFLSMLYLQKRRWARATLVFLPGIAWLIFHRPVSGFLASLGVDSFAEAKDFDFEEAKFWITTMGNVIRPNLNVKLFALYAAMAIGSFFGLHWLLQQTRFTARNRSYFQSLIALVFIASATHQTASQSISLYLKNSADFLTVRQNFSVNPPPIEADDKTVDVLVYIGESTSIMNMGIYGYPRETVSSPVK